MSHAFSIAIILAGTIGLSLCAYVMGQPAPFIPGMEEIGYRTMILLSVVLGGTVVAGLLVAWSHMGEEA